jgi:hypothetical protein
MRCTAFALFFVGGAAIAAAPPPGRYEATLCVSTSPVAPPSCGAAEFELRAQGQVQVRVADIVYHLHLRPAQVDVKTMQGKMELDEFSAEYEWRGNVLSFVDADKNVHYEVTPGAKVRTRP